MTVCLKHRFFLLSFVLHSGYCYDCPRGLHASMDGFSCYSPIAITNFISAERVCRQTNGHLPSIHDDVTNEQLLNMTKQFFLHKMLWIGIEKSNKWFDGTSFDYNNWGKNEPLKGFRKCAFATGDGNWYMRNCSDELPFICQIPMMIDEIEPKTLIKPFDIAQPAATESVELVQSGLNFAASLKWGSELVYTSTNKPKGKKKTNDDTNVPVWVVVVLSILGILALLLCIMWKCYYRFKKEIFEWKAFLIDRKNATTKERDDNVITSNTNTLGTSNQYQDIENICFETDDWEIEKENLLLCESRIIGSGAFANVYLAYLQGDIPLVTRSGNTLRLDIQRENNQHYQVAVKKLPPHASAANRIDFKHEMKFMKTLGYHPHVLSLFGVITSVVNPMIVLEYCENGDLQSYLRKHRTNFEKLVSSEIEESPLTPKHLLSIAWQISDGINYLSSHNYIHRDIAARNVLLTKFMSAKIGDFGLCRTTETSMYTAKGGLLPIKWMAIESLKYYEYSLKSDVWSFGVLLYELYSLGQAPYQTVQPHDMPAFLEQGNRLPQPDYASNEIYTIMINTWDADPKMRMNINEIREKLTVLLNSDSENYGYVDLKDLSNEVCPI